ncbi:MAG: serine/threonine-protein kinase, partial [Elainellaceae cyanobacterium]
MALNFLKSFRSGPGPSEPGQSDPTRALGGRYTITKQLGEGGFGQTFLAQDLHLPGRPQCVIKQLKPHDRGAQNLQVARRLFDTEARALYQLGAHPQIPRLLAHFEDGGEFYLAQELIDGSSLTTEFDSRRPWNEANVVAFLGDVLGTLTFVHDHRVIHRDLKPSNLIRRQQDDRIVLIDFGAVKRVGTQLISVASGPNPTVAVGTQGYMPSEQLAGQPRFSSDIYAVGIMGIQALTGQPMANLAYNNVTGEIDWHYHVPRATAALIAIIDTMVRYDFRTRYPTAREALAALQQLPPALSQHLPPMMTNSEIGALEEKAAEMTPG